MGIKTSGIERRKKRIYQKIREVTNRPRLAVYRSCRAIYGQIINAQGKTLMTVTEKELKGKYENGKKAEKARELGKILASKALKKGIKKVVFDRRGYLFHGRVKALAQGAREGGLLF